MRTRATRILVALALIGTAGLVLNGSGLACASMFGEGAAMSAVDFCFVFDCQNGAFGGLVDFCSTNSPDGPVFADCPEVVPEGTQ